MTGNYILNVIFIHVLFLNKMCFFHWRKVKLKVKTYGSLLACCIILAKCFFPIWTTKLIFIRSPQNKNLVVVKNKSKHKSILPRFLLNMYDRTCCEYVIFLGIFNIMKKKFGNIRKRQKCIGRVFFMADSMLSILLEGELMEQQQMEQELFKDWAQKLSTLNINCKFSCDRSVSHKKY